MVTNSVDMILEGCSTYAEANDQPLRNFSYENYVHRYYKSLPHFGDCMIEGRKGLVACMVLASYLVLFINFYFQTYKSPTLEKHNGVESSYTNGYTRGKTIDTA
ncbi:hypothetical protein D9756_010489 [Leucocoprinus leucothites]|uniref:Uncharacterized protein n=1 Tax=Leucocoprinus leucothites TaxID=201217 RepID=A0A8H5CWD2_9AGAR|nr:hypothetical protein D9756_010489 [Leucoagaricus leucothites]